MGLNAYSNLDSHSMISCKELPCVAASIFTIPSE